MMESSDEQNSSKTSTIPTNIPEGKDDALLEGTSNQNFDATTTPRTTSTSTSPKSKKRVSPPLRPVSFHSSFMFCTPCEAIDDNANGDDSKKTAKMLYVPAGDGGVISDDDAMAIESDDRENDGGKKKAKMNISNLSTESQLLLLNRVLDEASGVTAVKSYLHDEDHKKSKTVDVIYDPLRINLNGMVESLQKLGLDASLMNSIPSTARRDSHDDEDPTKLKTCRSSMHVEGICCATEVPQVMSILRVLGVVKVSINITSRMVYVDHLVEEITASKLADSLNREGFGATVRKDGGMRRVKKSLNSTIAKAGESTAELSPERIKGENVSGKYVESILMCPSLGAEEVRGLKEILEDEELLYEKVRYISPNMSSRTIKIEHIPKLVSAQNIADVLMASGGLKNVTVISDGQKEGMYIPDSIEVHDLDSNKWESERRCRRCRSFLPKGLGIHIVLSGIFWVLSLVGHFDEKRWYWKYFGIFSVLFGIPSVARKAYRTLRRGHFDANCMMVTAAFGAMFLQEFDEAASVSFLFSISEYLEDQATRKARIALDSIVNMRPEHANLIDPITGVMEIVPVDELETGCLVCVRTGDQIPSDGVIVEGTSEIDESSLTGESLLVTKQTGDAVSGGTINAGSMRLIVRTTSAVEDSAVSRLIRLVEESASNRSPTEQVVDSFAKSYTPAVICVAILMCTIPWFFGYEEGRRWTLHGLIMVVIACPCALTISTPVTYAAGLAATAQNGIIVKGGARLEALGSVKTIVFDKTGTLTEGKFRLNDLDTVGNKRTRKEVLELVAVMEAPSSHPLAVTLVDAAKKEGIGISNDMSVVNHTILKGEGVKALVNGEQVYVGNSTLFKRLGFYDDMDEDEKLKASEWNENGGTVGFIGIGGTGIIGMFCVADGVRPEAREVITTLQNEGIDMMMLTGDGDGAARSVSKEVGLHPDCVRSQFLPEDKLHCVASMLGFSRRKGGICSKKELLLFVGDGVNDAPALAVADVGVAMGAGAALAMEMSDVTLMDSNLQKLLFSLQMGKKVIRTVKENIAFSIFLKLIVIALSFAGKMTLLGAIAADVGVMLLVSLNGMKLLPGGREFCRRRKYNKVSMTQPDGEIV